MNSPIDVVAFTVVFMCWCFSIGTFATSIYMLKCLIAEKIRDFMMWLSFCAVVVCWIFSCIITYALCFMFFSKLMN